MARPTVLITSIGSRSAEGILASVAALRPFIRIVATNSVAEAPGLYDADVAYLVPPTAQTDRFLERMREILARERPSIVLNGRDEEVVALARLAEEAPFAETAFPLPPASIAACFNDKLLSARFAKEHDLPFAETAHSEAELKRLIAARDFPLVAKPRTGGFASRDVFVVQTEAQAWTLHERSDVVFQPFIGKQLVHNADDLWRFECGVPWELNPQNTSYMIDFVLGRDGQLISQCLTESERSGSIVRSMKLVSYPVLRESAQRHVAAFRSVGHRGPVNVQGIIDAKGRFEAFEWNARFVGSVPACALLGVNLVEDTLRHFVPALAQVPVPKPCPQMVFRPLAFRGVPISDVESLRSAGCWKRDSARNDE